jgi:hypothetical protein
MVRPRFKIMHYRLSILRYSDAEIIRAGKATSPTASLFLDQAAQDENALKYDALQQEWRRRHPRKRS